jgi:hypothetical protein
MEQFSLTYLCLYNKGIQALLRHDEGSTDVTMHRASLENNHLLPLSQPLLRILAPSISLAPSLFPLIVLCFHCSPLFLYFPFLLSISLSGSLVKRSVKLMFRCDVRRIRITKPTRTNIVDVEGIAISGSRPLLYIYIYKHRFGYASISIHACICVYEYARLGEYIHRAVS